MDADATNSLPAFGFLTTVHQPGSGYYGGYLVLAPGGRPLEFRCTTPVQPSRAQEILYGASLRSYLLGEIIGGALLTEATTPVAAIVIDSEEMAEIAALRREPVIIVDAGGQATLATPEFAGTNQPTADELLAPLTARVDLLEPFDRIRAALREAHDMAAHHAEQHDDDARHAA
ncbi:MAG: hypothetical protein CMJ58_24045 [Planctomycetaceae bacterium]|nr:hypothetical protein [Planctomycetaceae bacterium]